MQDRYAGDVGDFLKLGLMRHLAAPVSAGGTGLAMGLNWYLAPDEAHNADGKHIAYLRPGNDHHASLAACDPGLLGLLAVVVQRGRSAEALELSGALPSGSVTHSERLAPAWNEAARHAWHVRGLEALRAADVVFTDPDNGIRDARRGAKPHKYSLTTELADYARRGQSLVAYQHADRSASATIQARVRVEELAATVGQRAVGTIIARRGSCRFFLITAARAHHERLFVALTRFAAKWAPHAELVLPARPMKGVKGCDATAPQPLTVPR